MSESHPRTDMFLSMKSCLILGVFNRCEVFVSSNGETEKLASGLIEPFANHLSVLATKSLFRAEVEKNENNKSWFTRRTLERFFSIEHFAFAFSHKSYK